MKQFNFIFAVLASLVILSACFSACVCDTLNPGSADRAASVQNAGPSWNTLAASYSFASYPQSVNTTFEQAYNGSDFNADFDAILQDLAALLGTTIPPYTSSGKLNADLANWPDS